MADDTKKPAGVADPDPAETQDWLESLDSACSRRRACRAVTS
jgi:hypothetical protein